MIDRKNFLFVFGAGASMPYGFPSGSQLVQNMISWTKKDKLIYDYLINSGYSSRKIQAFNVALSKSGITSIDHFLEYRPDFKEVGKVIIALAISEYEHRSKDELYSGNPASKLYNYIYNKMLAKPEDFSDNKTSFITFNYDRSLEYFLSNGLKATHNLTTPEAFKLLNKLSIIHVHGKIGNLKHEKDQRRDPHLNSYGSNINKFLRDKKTFQNLGRISKMIKIIHEDEETNDAIKAEIQKADTIIFLGFGYNYTNLQKIGLKKDSGVNFDGVFVKGTTYKMTQKEINHKEAYLENIINRVGGIKLDVNDNKSLQYLREAVLLNPAR